MESGESGKNRVEAFIAEAQASGGSELANYQLFVIGLTDVLGLDRPQMAAEEELLARLVALNLERQEEERRGHVRWLRPDYQIPKLGAKVPKPEESEQVEADIALVAVAGKPKWPSDGLDQIRIVKDLLAKVRAPVLPNEISATFDGRNTQKRRDRVAEVLETLVVTGAARTGQLDGQNRYFVPR